MSTLTHANKTERNSRGGGGGSRIPFVPTTLSRSGRIQSAGDLVYVCYREEACVGVLENACLPCSELWSLSVREN
jgi:hypothetical protein